MSIFPFEAKIYAIALTAATIPLLAYVTISTQQSTRALIIAAEKSLESKSILAAHEVYRFVEERITDARILAQADALESSSSRKKSQYLTEIIHSHPIATLI